MTFKFEGIFFFSKLHKITCELLLKENKIYVHRKFTLHLNSNDFVEIFRCYRFLYNGKRLKFATSETPLMDTINLKSHIILAVKIYTSSEFNLSALDLMDWSFYKNAKHLSFKTSKNLTMHKIQLYSTCFSRKFPFFSDLIFL